MVVLKKETLVKAFNRYNRDFLESPECFEDITIKKEVGEAQLKDLLSYVNTNEYLQDLTDFNIKVIADFMDHCKDNGININDSLFESFFNA